SRISSTRTRPPRRWHRPSRAGTTWAGKTRRSCKERMMARNWIVQGDPTSSGGSVLPGSPFTDIDGTPVARVTDQATCPRHKGAYPIVDGDNTLVVDGQPVALHGSSLACGCKVLSAQQVRVFVDAGGRPVKAVLSDF